MSRQRRDEKQNSTTARRPRYYRNTTLSQDIRESIESAVHLAAPGALKYRGMRIDREVEQAVAGRQRRK